VIARDYSVVWTALDSRAVLFGRPGDAGPQFNLDTVALLRSARPAPVSSGGPVSASSSGAVAGPASAGDLGGAGPGSRLTSTVSALGARSGSKSATIAALRAQLAVLETKLEEEKERSVCSICTERPLNAVISPCGHAFCSVCARDARVQSCPMCRGPIERIGKLVLL
jgi:hypothetical protein